ncbi:MAG TPA: hypothetical protein EYG58_03610 [Nitrospirales bacterium]|nr:hypothetical protein [Nitrospirales bacterium]HIO69616.1 hypothetical protein [Nitrospirales bacterium]
MNQVKERAQSGLGWVGLAIGAIVLLLAAGSGVESNAMPEKDPKKIVGPKECGECHKAEVHTWRETKHSRSFKELPRKKEAKEVAEKLGVKRMKKDSACLNCHFTSGIKKGKSKAIVGISCESCHGPAKDWLKVHSDYGGKTVTREMETPEHKAKRLAAIKASGMIRPPELYRLAANCFQCHTIPNEHLVNVGGHKAGSEFDLVAWSQGEVRHNFFSSGGKKNTEASSERKRMLYVVGASLDLEYSLRALSKATEKGTFLEAMVKRVGKAMGKLKKIHGLVTISELKEMLAIAAKVKLGANQEAQITPAADKIRAVAQKVANNYDGSEWAAIDKVLPTADKYKGKPGKAPPGK